MLCSQGVLHIIHITQLTCNPLAIDNSSYGIINIFGMVLLTGLECHEEAMSTEGGEYCINDSSKIDLVAFLTLEVETLALDDAITLFLCKAGICFFLVEAITITSNSKQ